MSRGCELVLSHIHKLCRWLSKTILCALHFIDGGRVYELDNCVERMKNPFYGVKRNFFADAFPVSFQVTFSQEWHFPLTICLLAKLSSMWTMHEIHCFCGSFRISGMPCCWCICQIQFPLMISLCIVFSIGALASNQQYYSNVVVVENRLWWCALGCDVQHKTIIFRIFCFMSPFHVIISKCTNTRGINAIFSSFALCLPL